MPDDSSVIFERKLEEKLEMKLNIIARKKSFTFYPFNFHKSNWVLEWI